MPQSQHIPPFSAIPGPLPFPLPLCQFQHPRPLMWKPSSAPKASFPPKGCHSVPTPLPLTPRLRGPQLSSSLLTIFLKLSPIANKVLCNALNLQSSMLLSGLINFCPIIFHNTPPFPGTKRSPSTGLLWLLLAWNTFIYLSHIHLLYQTCLRSAAQRAESSLTL